MAWWWLPPRQHVSVCKYLERRPRGHNDVQRPHHPKQPQQASDDHQEAVHVPLPAPLAGLLVHQPEKGRQQEGGWRDGNGTCDSTLT